MMDLSDFTAQVQAAHWGWTIALFLWLVGLSGMGMFLNNWVREKALVYVCTITGIVGTLLVVSHLTRILNLPMAAISALLEMSFNFGSWMFIGICLLVVQCCLTLFYSCVFAGVIFKGECCRKLVAGDWFNWIAAAVGVAATIYSGFLLTQAVGVTLWNTALIPLLWIMSGMASAMGCPWKLPPEMTSSAAARAGAEALLSGPQAMMFLVGAVLCGSLIPFAINLTTRSHKVVAVGAVLGIVGALLLRASVLFAGYYEPILL